MTVIPPPVPKRKNGRGVAIRTRPINGGTLRFVSHGSFRWSLDAYADRVARTVDAERKEAWSDQDVSQLAYDRGQPFAFLLEHALRSTGKRGWDGIMLAMRDRWQAAPANAKPLVIANLLAAIDAAGFDMRPMLAKYIDAGDTIVLPEDLFAGCATIARARLRSSTSAMIAWLPVKAVGCLPECNRIVLPTPSACVTAWSGWRS